MPGKPGDQGVTMGVTEECSEYVKGLADFLLASTSSISRNRGKSLRSIKCSINPKPTLHLRHSTTSLIISSHQNLYHNITLPTTIDHHLRHKINYSSHHHPRHILTPWIQKVCWPTTYISHHGAPITKPHLYLNTKVTPTHANSSCATKLSKP
jgi:hypothetical protein